MKLTKRILSLFLCMALVIGFIPMVTMPAKAADATETYQKITSTDDLTSGGKYLIVYETDGKAYVLNSKLTNLDVAGNYKYYTITDNKITPDADMYVTIESVTGGYSIKTTSGYYIGSTSDANDLLFSTSTAYASTITFNDDGTAHIVGSSNAVLRYNANSGQYRFRYFKSSTYESQKAICLYKLVEAGGSETPTCDHANAVVQGATEATCTEAGYTGDTYCPDCDKTLEEGTIIPAGHKDADKNLVCDVCGAILPNAVTYDFTETASGSSAMSTDALKNVFDAAASGSGLNQVTTSSYIYAGNSSGGAFQGSGFLKAGKSGNAGQMVLEFDKEVTKVEITCHTWNKDGSDTVAVNGSDAQTAPNTGVAGVLTFDLSDAPSETVTIDVNERGFIYAITVTFAGGETSCEHAYTSEQTKAPTCTEAGELTYTCSTCGDTYTEAVAALGHTEVVDAAVAAGCETTGKTEGKHCSVCNEVLVAQNDVAALGHAWDEGVIDPEPTCEGAGVKTYTCETCGTTKTEAVSALGHTAAEAVIENNVAATCTADGSYDTVVYCSVCNAEISRVTTTVDALGHSYVGEVTQEPTLNAEGIKTYTCSGCGDSYTETLAKLEGAVAQIGDTKYASVQEAIDAAVEDDTIVLLINVELTETLTIAADKVITLDLNSFDISYSSDVAGEAMITNKGTLTLTGNGAVNFTYTGVVNMSKAANAISNLGNLTIDGVSVTNTTAANGQIGYAVDNYSGAVLTVESGSVTVSGSYYYDAIRMFCNSETADNTVVINGGTVGTIWMQNPSDGATRNTKDTVKGNLAINGGTVGTVYLEPCAAFKVSITGGNIAGVQANDTANSTSTSVPTGFVSGGTFSAAVPEAFCAEGFIPTENADGTYGVKEGSYVAQIGDVKYETLAEAIAAAQAGENVELLADHEGTVVLPANVKLDLNGKTITGNIVGTVAMNGGTWITPENYEMAGPEADYYKTSDAVITVDATGNITIEDGTMTLAQSWWTGKGQTLTIAEDATFVIPEGMTLNVLSTVIINGTVTNNGTLNLYSSEATVTIANEISGIVTTVTNAKVVYVDGVYAVHVHVWSDATCTAPATCACGDTKGEALGHSYNAVVTAPTCTEDGYTTYTCACGDSYTADVVAATGHTEGTAVKENWVSPSANADGSYDKVVYCSVCGEELSRESVVVEMPDATVTVLDSMILTEADDYMCWPSGATDIDRLLQIVMNFQANETLEQAKAGEFGKYICDFYLTFEGLSGDSIISDNCYLAGNYGDYGWIVIPVDGLELEEGVTYPIVAAYDANLTYEDICGSVKNFTAAIYIDPAILEANPDMTVTLELRMTNPENADDVMVIGEPAVYTVADLTAGNAEAQIGSTYYGTLQEALDAAIEGDTVKLLANAELNALLVMPGVTLDLNGYTVEASYVVGFNGSDIIDSSAANTGLVKVAQDRVMLDLNNSQLPVYNNELGGYLFLEINIVTNLVEDTENDVATFKFYIKKDLDYMMLLDLMRDGAADNNLTVMVKLSWTTLDGNSATQYYAYSEDMNKHVAEVHSTSKYSTYTCELKGINSRESITYAAVLQSGTGAELTFAG
ncbi:MAG: hypothetical protein E7455_06670 [Ruminococcaceae bacterium]|nr:hypothetical protein [Oscillospiraceae bacterium]